MRESAGEVSFYPISFRLFDPRKKKEVFFGALSIWLVTMNQIKAETLIKREQRINSAASYTEEEERRSRDDCLRESSRTRTLLAWDSSEQPNTARIPHILDTREIKCW